MRPAAAIPHVACFLLLGLAAYAQNVMPYSVIRECAFCPDIVLLPRGQFVMGVGDGEEARENVPMEQRGRSEEAHAVTISRPFFVAGYAVTVAEYAEFIARTGERPMETGCWTWRQKPDGGWPFQLTPGATWRNPGFVQTSRDPVVRVSHTSAEAHTAWLARTTGRPYRLPSEAEWEYAALAVTSISRQQDWSRPCGNDHDSACAHANVRDVAEKANCRGLSRKRSRPESSNS